MNFNNATGQRSSAKLFQFHFFHFTNRTKNPHKCDVELETTTRHFNSFYTPTRIIIQR